MKKQDLNNFMDKYRSIKNKILLRLGFTLFNKKGFVTVYLRDGKQVKSNPNRKTDYRLHDDSWVISKVSPEKERIKELHNKINKLKGSKVEHEVKLRQAYWDEIQTLKALTKPVTNA